MIKTSFTSERFLASDDSAKFEDALLIRRRVFVDEQNGSPDVEPDAYDAQATQWLLRTPDGIAAATGRLIPANGTTAKIGRIAVLKEFRGMGLAGILMESILDHAVKNGFKEAVLEAQTYATGLYEKCGFKSEGAPFLDEDQIEHILMRKVF